MALALVFLGAINAQTPPDISNKGTPCSEKSAKVLILGAYHMDNPGQDAINVEADDVLAPKRQKEISEVVEKLAHFRPTKIAIESPYRSTYWTTRYEQYVKSEYKLGKNEIEQIGFQLAKRQGHSTLYPIDFPMWMDGSLASEREEPKATPTPAPAKSREPKRELPPHLKKFETVMRTSSVLEALRYQNSREYVEADHAGYMDMLLPQDKLHIYENADQITNWYKRNLRMFTNINRVTEFPNDRILLIVGAGHLKILSDFAASSTYFCLVNSNDYLK